MVVFFIAWFSMLVFILRRSSDSNKIESKSVDDNGIEYLDTEVLIAWNNPADSYDNFMGD